MWLSAAQNGHVAIIYLLLAEGFNVHATNRVSVMGACYAHRYLPLLMVLIGLQIGLNALNVAVEYNRCEVVNVLLKQGADVNTRTTVSI